MYAHASEPASTHAAKDPGFVHNPDSLSAPSAESLSVAQVHLEAIDFEIAAAHTLSGVWHAEPGGHVYLVRALERISAHMKAVRANQLVLIQPEARRTL